MTMSTRAIDAFHDIHTATNDVLKGYREMAARAEPEIQTVIHRLTDMHERHAAEQSAELAGLRDAGKDDSSLQGTRVGNMGTKCCDGFARRLSERCKGATTGAWKPRRWLA
jgi:hypothetical protein